MMIYRIKALTKAVIYANIVLENTAYLTVQY